MGFWQEWQIARQRRKRAAAYLEALRSPAADPDVVWLTALGVPADLAAREMLFARRAIGLIVAERDALDDQTAADVAHALNASLAATPASAAPLWQARWRAYAAALATRGSTEVPARRMARVLLEGAEVPTPTVPQLAAATGVMQALRGRANEALREIFGVASLPEDVRPSAMKG